MYLYPGVYTYIFRNPCVDFFFYKSSCLFCMAFYLPKNRFLCVSLLRKNKEVSFILQIRQQLLHSSRSFCMYQAGWHLLRSSIGFGSGGIPAAQDHKPLCSLLDAGDGRSCGECSSSHCCRAPRQWVWGCGC